MNDKKFRNGLREKAHGPEKAVGDAPPFFYPHGGFPTVGVFLWRVARSRVNCSHGDETNDEIE